MQLLHAIEHHFHHIRIGASLSRQSLQSLFLLQLAAAAYSIYRTNDKGPKAGFVPLLYIELVIPLPEIPPLITTKRGTKNQQHIPAGSTVPRHQGSQKKLVAGSYVALPNAHPASK